MLTATFAASAVAFAICVAALIITAPAAALVATGYGAATLASVVAIRRLGFGPWGMAGFGVPALALAGLLMAGNPELRTLNVALAFAKQWPTPLLSMSQRILDDAPMAGIGAGSFAAIAPLYRDIDERSLSSAAPSAAATVAIELGQPMLWLIVAVVLGATIILLRAALRRGRDSFYPMAGAGCLITLLVLCFVNTGLLGTATALVAATAVGLAFGQSRSRTVQQ